MFVFVHSLVNPYIVSGPPSEIQVKNVGDSVRINCTARGLPLPKVKWFKDKNSVIPIATHNQEESIKSEILITRFKPSDAGKYYCVFLNDKNGTAIANTSLSM